MTQISNASERQKGKWPLIAGPAFFIISLLIPSPDPENPLLAMMAGITVWIALWWLTESVPIAVTAFLPFLLIPSCGITDIKLVSAQYMDPILFLFIGGFLIAFAIEKWGLHRRLALNILSRTGKTASSTLLGVMCTSYFFSMWMSNTATVMMLISAVMAVTVQLKSQIHGNSDHRKFSSAMMIGLAYAASIGGMATLVGTPTNMIFFRAYNERYGSEHPIQFVDWMSFAFPMSLLFLVITFFIIRILLLRKSASLPFNTNLFREEKIKSGKWNRDEKVTAFLFLLTAFLWLTRADIDFSGYNLKGWASSFPYPEQITDSTVAMAVAFIFFLIPSKTEPGRNLLTWNEANKLPYEIILLFGSGFALAKGFESTGLSKWLALHLHSIRAIPVPLIVLSICVIVTVISEFASNVASIQLILPVIFSMQSNLDISPATLLVPAALSASLGFMLPVATAPNTIVFASGHIKVKEMIITGLFVDIAGILLITLLALYAV